MEGEIIESKHRKTSKGQEFEITYTYQVENKTYVADRLGFSWTRSRDLEKVLDIVRRYPAGEKVTVYYSTKEHSFAVLEPDRQSKFSFLFIFGLSFSGTFGLAYLIKRKA